MEVRLGSKLVRIYHRGRLIKVHPRQDRGGRSTDPDDYPAELSAYTLRAPEQIKRSAASQGPAVAAYAERLFDGPLPWAKLRQGHKLIRLGERYSPERLDAACRRALSVDLIDVRRLERILVEALEQEATQPEPPPMPPGRFARPGAVFARANGPHRSISTRRTLMTTTTELTPLLKRLKLGAVLNTLPERVALARREQLDYASFLQIILTDEINRRDHRRLELRLQRAGFEQTCRLEDFDWSASITLDRRLLDAAFSLQFLARNEHVLLVGPVGVGKSFIAQALGYAAVRAGHTVRFVHADDFFRAMAQARVDHSTDKTFRSFLAPDLLILDDPRSPQDDPTAVHRPLRAGHRQASYRQLRHHLQQGCRRVARTLRRLHPGQQRPRPARQRQLPDRHRRRQLPRTLVTPQGSARPKGGG